MTEKKGATVVAVPENKEVKAVVIRDKKTGELQYVLDFTRDSVKWAERQGFKVQKLEEGIMISAIDDLFFYSFHAHYPDVKRAEAEDILQKNLGGMTPELLERLIQLYLMPVTAMMATEESLKNADMTIEL